MDDDYNENYIYDHDDDNDGDLDKHDDDITIVWLPYPLLKLPSW